MPWAMRVRSTPICANPRAAPPPNTRPIESRSSGCGPGPASSPADCCRSMFKLGCGLSWNASYTCLERFLYRNDNAIRAPPGIISPRALIGRRRPQPQPDPPALTSKAGETPAPRAEGRGGGSALAAAAGRTAHGEAQLRRRAVVVMIAGAHDRPHRTGVEQAVANELVVDIHPDPLAEHHMAVGGTALIIGEGHGLHPFAFERAR